MNDELDLRRRACAAYGINFVKRVSGFFASHVVAGFIGPFADEAEAVEVAYNKWVKS